MKIPAMWFTVLLMGAAVPLVLRKIPPNAFYGFRTPKTRSTPEIWYDANYHAGVNLLVACALTLLVMGFVAMRDGAMRANAVGLPVMATLVIASLLVSFVQLHRM